ncbi:hypothetical protein SKAU_G00257640 [Synaphobranchus kaupii]|uniref:Uncharacterized protein n=1 Tax=Synaphobranchus kaupii TaxID=118154 RepID=A0A9Q1F483_SYNKA|nr:hypothetical protein SKAU_G00257640 [Synaphobranchus kaupii]
MPERQHPNTAAPPHPLLKASPLTARSPRLGTEGGSLGQCEGASTDQSSDFPICSPECAMKSCYKQNTGLHRSDRDHLILGLVYSVAGRVTG